MTENEPSQNAAAPKTLLERFAALIGPGWLPVPH